jgi:hypothetical protein
MLCKNEDSLMLRPARLLAHKLLELPFLHTPFGLLLHAYRAIPCKQTPYAKTNSIKQPGLFSAQSRLQAGNGNKGGKQEKYRRFHS